MSPVGPRSQGPESPPVAPQSHQGSPRRGGGADDLDLHLFGPQKKAGQGGSRVAPAQPEVELAHRPPRRLSTGTISAFVGLIGATGLAAAAILFSIPHVPNEATSKNWKYVEKAKEFSDAAGHNQLAQVTAAGQVSAVPWITLGKDDVDQKLRSSLSAAATKGDVKETEKVFREANKIPIPAVKTDKPLPIQPPQLTAGLNEAILKGDADFLHLFIFDCCDEDGDVVELFINDQSFAIVPLTNQGATLSVPVVSLPTKIAVKGIRDGVGGVTVAFATSQGKLFARTLAVGETMDVGMLEP